MTDSTNCVCYDGTMCLDSTACIVDPFEGAVAGALANSFDSSMGAMNKRCEDVGSTLNDIKGRISSCTISDPTKLDGAALAGLSAALGASAWADAADMAGKAENVFNKCAAAAKEFADSSALVDELAGPVTDMSKTANADAIADFKKTIPPSPSPDTDFTELELGKELNELAGTGRTIADPVITKTTPITDKIRTGIGKLNKTKTLLSDLTAELGHMDQLIGCVSDIGGPGMASTVDDMIGQLDCMYNNLGCFSDPNMPNYGEFNVDSFLSTEDPVKASNIKKGMNLSNAVISSAESATERASYSIGAPTNTAFAGPSQDTISAKKLKIESKSKTVFVVPAQGKEPEKLVEIPEPPPPVIPEVKEAPPPEPPPPMVPLTKYINHKDNTYDRGYGQLDPYLSFMNDYYAAMVDKIKTYQISSPDGKFKLYLNLKIVLRSTNARVTSMPNGSTWAVTSGVAEIWYNMLTSDMRQKRLFMYRGYSERTTPVDKAIWKPDPNIHTSLVKTGIQKAIASTQGDAIFPYILREEDFQNVVNDWLGL